MMSIKQTIKSVNNKHLIETINKIRKEKENPEIYGKNGTSRWVTSSEFWEGHHQDLKAELKRRQNAGLVKKSAGNSNKKRSNNSFGVPTMDQLMRM